MVGLYFVGIIVYLVGGLPLIWIALQEFGWVNQNLDAMAKLKIHAICVALFLVFGHIAMISGMLDPSLLGYTGPGHGAAPVRSQGQSHGH